MRQKRNHKTVPVSNEQTATTIASSRFLSYWNDFSSSEVYREAIKKLGLEDCLFMKADCTDSDVIKVSTYHYSIENMRKAMKKNPLLLDENFIRSQFEPVALDKSIIPVFVVIIASGVNGYISFTLRGPRR